MRAVLLILFLPYCFFSCNNVSTQRKDKVPNIVQTVPEIENSKSIQGQDKWIEVKFDKTKGDYFIENPCDGHTPNIEMTQSTLVDDRGLDEPITYRVQQHFDIDKNHQLLKLSYEWTNSQLTDSIIISKMVDGNGIYKWIRYPKYNGVPQDTLMSLFVFGNQIEKTRVVKIKCPDRKIIELEKKPFE